MNYLNESKTNLSVDIVCEQVWMHFQVNESHYFAYLSRFIDKHLVTDGTIFYEVGFLFFYFLETKSNYFKPVLN